MHRISMRVKWNLYKMYIKLKGWHTKDNVPDLLSFSTIGPSHTVTLFSNRHTPAPDHGSTRQKELPPQSANQHHHLHPQTNCPYKRERIHYHFLHPLSPTHEEELSSVLADQVTVTHSLRPDGAGTASECIYHHLPTPTPQSTCLWVTSFQNAPSTSCYQRQVAFPLRMPLSLCYLCLTSPILVTGV